MNKLLITSAYGRKYNNVIEMMADWEQGKDFRLQVDDFGGFTYCSIRDTEYLREHADRIHFVCDNRLVPYYL